MSFTLGGADRVAFAVYSDDDKSLDFYKRLDVPKAGDTYNGKTVTEVYTDFEDRHYVFETEGSSHVPWFDIRKKVKSVQVVDDGIRPYYTHAWFAQMESLTDCDIAKLDTSRSAVFYDMFNGCTSLESLDLTHMDTSSAKYMGYMLKDCPKLKTVDVSSFDTSKCQDLSIFFSGDSALTEIRGLGNWDTSSCRWMNLMFNGCGSLTQIYGLENWDVRSVETTESMFEQCQKLRSVDISHFEGKSLKSAKAMFFHCYSLTTVDVSELVTGTCTVIGCMFDGCTGLTSIQGLDKWDVSNIKECHQAFYYCCSLQKIDLASWQFSPSGTIQAMFYNCSSLRELDLSGFDLHEAESGWGLFEQVTRLQRITLGPDWKWVDVNGYLPAPSSDSISGADGKWYSVTTGQGYAPADIPSGKADTYVASKELLPKVAFAVYSADDGSLDFYKRAFCDVPAVGDAFEGKAVTAVYTGFETSRSVKWDSVCYDIKSVAVVDTGIRPTSTESWFENCKNLVSVDLGKLDMSHVQEMGGMFYSCEKMTSIDFSQVKSGSINSMSGAFNCCMALKSIDLSGLATTSSTDMESAFLGCRELTEITLGEGFVWGTGSTNLPSETFTKWKADSDGGLYSSSEIPSGRADTYRLVDAKPTEPSVPDKPSAPGSGGSGSSAGAKDAADWTLDDQQTAAEDIAAKGEASPFYAKAKAAMDAGTTWSMQLTNGKTLIYRIVGIDHDDLADGTGRAGLTFEATNDALGRQRVNATDTNAGGWEKSELRGRLNSGDLWAFLPAEVQSKAKAVTKTTDNKGGGSTGTASATTDKVFLLSSTEVWGDLNGDGSQYEYYASKGVTKSHYSGASSSYNRWTRSVRPNSSMNFLYVNNNGDWYYIKAAHTYYVFPAWCF